MADDKSTRVEISYKTIVFTAAFLIGLWFLFQIRDIIVLVFLSIILVSALLKPVEWLTARRIPRVVSILIVYLLVIAFISFAVGIIVPPLVSETSAFVSNLPSIVSNVNDFLVVSQIPVNDLSQVIGNQINGIAGNIVSITTAVFSSVFVLLTMIVLSFYILMEWKNVQRLVASPFSGAQEKKVISLVSQVEKGLGAWVRGQLTLSIIVGVVTFIGLTILGIPYALPLALIAGILEIVPLIGPIVASIPAILVGLTISPLIGLAVAALFLIVQQLENHLIVPMVMSKVVGLQPAIVIVAVLIGAKLGGVGGALLAVPVVIVAKIFIRTFLTEDQKFEEELREE